jgi:probable phosphomutase (TIGR03848 family)
MLLLLVRHGVTPMTGTRLTGRLPGIHLSEEGVRQAKDVAERLAHLPVKAVYSSPLERCQETAAPIAERHRVELRTVDDLAEVAYGQWQGRPYRQLYRLKAWSELQAHPADFRFPGGETIREAQTRGIRATEAIRARHPRTAAVVVVSHADMIRLIVAGYLGLGTDLYQRIVIGVASVSAIVLGERVPRLLRIGDSGSLEGLAERLKPPAKSPASPAATKRAARADEPSGKETTGEVVP